MFANQHQSVNNNNNNNMSGGDGDDGGNDSDLGRRSIKEILEKADLFNVTVEEDDQDPCRKEKVLVGKPKQVLSITFGEGLMLSYYYLVIY